MLNNNPDSVQTNFSNSNFSNFTFAPGPDLLDLLESGIHYRPLLASVTGTLAGGVYLSQFLYWDRIQRKAHPNREGWFYKYQSDWADELNTSEATIKRANTELVKRGVIEVKKISMSRGARPTTWVRLDRKRLTEIINEEMKSDWWREREVREKARQEKYQKELIGAENFPWIDTPEKPKKAEKRSETPVALRKVNLTSLEEGQFDLSRERSICTLSHTENTNKEYKQKTTTTHAQNFSKIHENDFLEKSLHLADQMAGEDSRLSGQTMPTQTFAIQKLKSLYRKFSHPEPVSCAQIVLNDWLTQLNNQQQQQQQQKPVGQEQSQPTTEELTDRTWADRYDFDMNT